MHAVCRCTAGLLSPPVNHQLRHAICFPFASSLQHLLSLLQAVLDAALQREQLAGAPDEYADAVGAWDAAEGAAAGSNGGGAAAKQSMKVVLITGFESFNVDLYKKVGWSGGAQKHVRISWCLVRGPRCSAASCAGMQAPWAWHASTSPC